jgi:hypothetical protein
MTQRRSATGSNTCARDASTTTSTRHPGGLAAARGAEDGKDLPRLREQRDDVQHDDAAELTVAPTSPVSPSIPEVTGTATRPWSA